MQSMRKLMVPLVLGLIFLSIPAGAESTDPYAEFWEILERTAGLIVEFNATANETLAPALINSTLDGIDNAITISTLVWEAKEELEASGVQLYYTEEELRAMAEEVSQNGLPPETVENFREQGWSESEILALQSYIANNVDEINGDFNMSEFLENFSIAFINVSFKYADYSAWALERWKWNGEGTVPEARARGIPPGLLSEWNSFYSAYLEGDYEGALEGARTLRKRIYALSTAEDAERLGSGVLVMGLRWEHIPLNGTFVTIERRYYWNAIESYRLALEAEAVLAAKVGGNGSEKLNGMLAGKVEELRDSLYAPMEFSIVREPLRNR
ncbi:hypothetical protein [Palaeococcus ferrophilus]|uniref:hypothetical protein n=1 Tax=Palaeococcus ferrophilus TaxID=83868 RepID=UPI00064EE28E|nr:hypothetical protein [Palaeococcus ferrophilus]